MMSIFNFFNKKNTTQKSEPALEKEIVPIKQEARQNSTAVSNEIVLKLHPDLEGLVWVKDGKFKNYDDFVNDKYEAKKFASVEDFYLYVEFQNDEEPSLIYTTLPVKFPENIHLIERPPYWPIYKELTPEQRGIYLQLLANPYNTEIDIGYVFILYYGLERHLLKGDIDRAVDVILKLRDVHKNKSFQQYSATAIILSSLLRGKGENVLKFMHSLDKDFEFNFSDNLYLMSAYSFNFSLTVNDIVRMAKTFEFTNTNYIKKYPDRFIKNLNGLLMQKYEKNTIDLKSYFTPAEIKKLPTEEELIFANKSIIDTTIKIPQLTMCFKLKRDMNIFLEAAHELTKLQLAELRKAGKIKPESPKSTQKDEMNFNGYAIKSAFEKYKKDIHDKDDKAGVIDFDKNFDIYSKMRIEASALEKHDITQSIIRYIKILGKTTPSASLYWDRPMILLERIKMYEEALFICERAVKVSRMPHVRMGDFDVRLERLSKKVEKIAGNTSGN